MLIHHKLTADVLDWLGNLVNDPPRISKYCLIYIGIYYFVSYISISAAQSKDPKLLWNRLWKRNGFLDILTSVTCSAFAIILIWSLSTLAFKPSKTPLTLGYLITYYFLFIFLFAFCYGILEWHSKKGMFEGICHKKWKSLVIYLLISIQTQTTIGYTRNKPKHLLAEVITSLQALLGIFLITISIARAVNQLKGP